MVATAGGDDVTIWDAKAWKEITTLQFSHGVARVAFSPDGKYFATTGFTEPGRLYETATWKLRHKLTGIETTTRCVIFAPDGKTLATSGSSNLVTFWDVASGQPRKSLPAGVERLGSLALTPDGKTLAAAGSGKVVFWDLAHDKIRAILEVQKGWICNIAFSFDGQTLVSVDSTIGGKRPMFDFDPKTRKVKKRTQPEDNRVLLWNTANGKLKCRVKLEDDMLQASAAAFSPSGKILAVVGHGDVLLWDVLANRRWARIKARACQSVAFSPDGKLLLGGYTNGTVVVWDVPEKEAPREEKVPESTPPG
jgi:WD40 repeat protein